MKVVKQEKNLDVISQRPRLHLTPKIGEHKEQQEERQLSAHSLQRRRKTYIDDVHIVRPHKQYYIDARPIATKHGCKSLVYWYQTAWASCVINNASSCTLLYAHPILA